VSGPLETDPNTDQHVPVLCEETIDLVMAAEAPSDGVFLDATFGRGGHTRALLRRLGPEARVVAVDRDPQAVEAGRRMASEDERLTMVHGCFAELADILVEAGVEQLDGAIMDLGVSSPQLDDAARGFSFRGDGPLDMRMDTSRGETAAEWLNRAREQEIADVIRRLGEERYARRIAAAIVGQRPLDSTRELADVIRAVVPTRGGRTDAATRSFQAIRMQVNDELGQLEAGLETVFERLRPGGRLAVISFHSLEDRVVKKTFRRLAEGPSLPRNLPVRNAEAARGRIAAGPVRASAAEVARNPRSRSAALRVLERVR
jgi:16S rRNA (cytosine1402-N4)-methyltransferase